MHPKILKTTNTLLRRTRKAEKHNDLAYFMDTMIEKYPELKLSYSIDSFGDFEISSDFSKRSDIDPFLIDLSNEFSDDSIPKLNTYDGLLSSAHYHNIYKMNFKPISGSPCEMVQVGERWNPGFSSPIYKMRCEDEHEKAEKAVLEANGTAKKVD